MDFQGKVINFIGETSGVSKAGNPWKKKEWLVETFGQYPRKVRLQIFGDRADTINLEVGQDYNLFVDLESREFNGRWYTDVTLYRADPITAGQNMGPGAPAYPGGYPSNMAPQGGYPNPPYPSNPSNAGGVATTFTAEIQESDEDLPF